MKRQALIDAPISSRALIREVELLAAAVRDDSNLELDWLWLYMQLSDEGVRRYCLERALRINPRSDIAQRELARIQRRWPSESLSGLPQPR